MTTTTANSSKTNQKLVPQLRFPEFSGEWERKSLGDIASKIMYGIGAAATEFDGVNKYLRITDIDEENRNFNYDSLTSPKGNVDEKYFLEEGDIVFARTGASVGKSYLYNKSDGKLVFAGFLIKVNIHNQNPNFVFQNTLTSSYDKWVKLMSMRSGQPGINAQEYKRLTINLPQLLEQQKIANFLSLVDQKIDLLQQQKTALKTYKKGLLQQLFPSASTPSTPSTSSGTEALKPTLRFKDDNGNAFPDWEEKKMMHVLTIGSGKDYKHLEKGNIPVYGTGGIMLYVNDYLYDGESVGIGRKGTIDKPVYLKGKFWTVDTLFYTHSFISALPEFIYFTFLTIDWKKYNEASGVPSLSKKTIEKLKINLPCLAEQTKIANFLSLVDQRIENVQTQVTKTKEFKKGLLQQLFV